MSDPIDENELNEDEQFADPDLENELKRIKLALEHGMDLSKPLADSGLPPEIESRFLDYVQQWEDEMAKGKMIVVYDLIGRPHWLAVSELNDEEVVVELEKVMDILHKNSLHIDTVTQVGDREMYRFITEELFQKETHDVKIEGMMHCFIYEEYHPNHEHDIKARCTGLIDHIMDKADDVAPEEDEKVQWGTSEIIAYLGKDYLRAELNRRLRLFSDSFSSFTVHQLDFNTIHINDDNTVADVIAHISYTGVIDGGYESIDFEGDCRFSLRRDEEWWIIDSFEIPGVVV